jgi:hypothetical protein
MQEDIYTVIAAVKHFIANNEYQQTPIIAQVNFKQRVNKHWASTDLNLLHKAIEHLKVSNRSQPPENTATALDIATRYLEDNGVILMMNCEMS